VGGGQRSRSSGCSTINFEVECILAVISACLSCGGDVTVFGDVYRAEYTRLVAELYAMTGSLPEAEDVVQEAFAKALARWERVSMLDQPAAWIRRVALNDATSRWRMRRRHVGGPISAELADPAVTPEPVLALTQALSRLPVVQRQAIVLHHLSGLSVEEIATTLRCPNSTVKARLQRGRARLAVLLAAEDPKEVSGR